MAERATIRAELREVLGKKVKQLRRQGILPANVYGRGVESAAIQLDGREFLRSARTAGIHAMYELEIAGEKKPRHVILRGLTRRGGTGEPVHVDFYQVDLRRPIQTTASLHLVGDPPAVRDLAGTLLHSLETIAIRCLPLDIPDRIEVDVTPLKSFDVTITVGDLEPPPGVEFLTDPGVVVATVTPPRLRTAEEEAEEEKKAAPEEGAEAAEPAEEAEE